ncbi:MAG: hypothetical protein ABI743_13915, partial [bacterium]
TLTRLMDLKVESYMIAATVEAVLAQRLVRKICADCRESYQPDSSIIALLDSTRPTLESPPLHSHIRLSSSGQRDNSLSFYRGTGCASCRQTGFRGRTGIFELMLMTDELRQELLNAPNISALRKLTHRDGMVSLKGDGWQKVKAGITTVEEVLRVAD